MKRFFKINTNGLSPRAWAALLLALCICSCAPAAKEPAEPTPVPPPATAQTPPPEQTPAPQERPEPQTPDTAPAPPLPTLRQLISQKTAEQHSPLSSIYALPEPGFGNKYFIELFLDQQTTLLSQSVQTFTGNMDGLALGFASGTIQVLGDLPCRALTLPEDRHVDLLAWHPGSPVIAVSEAETPVVRVFELFQCAEIASMEQPSKPNHLAITRDGNTISVVDEVYDLWIGASIGPLAKAARLRFQTLDLAFSPAGGIVLVVDQMGWLTSWSAQTGESIRTVQIPGGLFNAAEIMDSTVRVTDLEGNIRVWSIPDDQFIDTPPQQRPFRLEGGMLLHTTLDPSYQKRLHLGRPPLETAFSPGSEVLRISDIDGTSRFYSMSTGLPTTAVQAEDWAPLEIDDQGSANLEGTTFKVADAVQQSGIWRLMARHVPEETFYVWWIQSEGPIQSQATPGELPLRFGVKPDQVAWRQIFTTDAQVTIQQE